MVRLFIHTVFVSARDKINIVSITDRSSKNCTVVQTDTLQLYLGSRDYVWDVL